MIIRIDDTGISHGVLGIANQLPNPSTVEPGSEVVFRFSRGEFVFVTGLVLLAAWRKALPAGVVVHVDDDTCFTPAQRFLTSTGFREIIETGVAPKLIISNESLHDAGAPHCQDTTPVFDTFVRAEATHDRVGDFG